MDIDAKFIDNKTYCRKSEYTKEEEDGLDGEPVDKGGIVYWGDGEEFHGPGEYEKLSDCVSITWREVKQVHLQVAIMEFDWNSDAQKLNYLFLFLFNRRQSTPTSFHLPRTA